MVEAVVKRLDRANGRVVVETDDGRELTLLVDERTEISVKEPATMGDILGTLDEVGVGYLVSVDFTEGEDGCRCHSLASIS